MTFEELVDAYDLYRSSMLQEGETAMPFQDFAWFEAGSIPNIQQTIIYRTELRWPWLVLLAYPSVEITGVSRTAIFI